MKTEIVMLKEKETYPCLKAFFYNFKDAEKIIVYFISPRTGICLHDDLKDSYDECRSVGKLYNLWFEDKFVRLRPDEKVVLSND